MLHNAQSFSFINPSTPCLSFSCFLVISTHSTHKLRMGGGGADENKKFQKSYFDVLGLCCSSEVPLIENILKRLEGVKQVSVVVPSRTVIVVHDTLLISELQIVKALNEARLEANVRVHGESSEKKKWPSPYAAACGVLLLLSLLKYVYRPLGWLALAAVAFGILPMALKAFASIRNLRLDANVLMLIAVIGTIAMGDYLEAATIVFLFTIAEWLESRASQKATAVMSSLMSLAPQRAVIAETGEEVKADEVKVNTIIAVKAGEVIPIDGIVVEGRCEVDEKTFTGESFPVSKQMDSAVFAGTINLNGYISVKTTTVAEDCVVAKMAKLVEEAQNNKTKTQRMIDRCAKYYTPCVVMISASLIVAPLALSVDNRSHWFHLALVVLVSACPCALILSTPVATFCALSQAATQGVLVKGGDHLEVLGKMKVLALDKTGTITRGEFVVSDFKSLQKDITFHTLLYWLSSIESKSSHPMADALVDYGRSHSIEPKPENVEDFQIFPGEGICGKIDGKHVYIGNRKIGLRAGCQTVPILQDEDEEKSIGYIYIGATKTPAGVFSLSDECRTGALEAVKELKLLGIKTIMLTGDCRAAAMNAQAQLGNVVDEVQWELLPEDKARIIRGLKKEGLVGMVGDGVNDAPALATADVGISMGVSGSALASETGNIILMSNDIRKIPSAIKMARRTNRKVIENIILSVSTKAAILALAIAGHPLVWAAVLADVGTCLLVIFNSMLLLRGGRNHHHSHSHSHSHSHNPNHCSSLNNKPPNTESDHSTHNHGHNCNHVKAQKTSTDLSHNHNKCCVGVAPTNHKISTTSSHNHNHKHCCSDIIAPIKCTHPGEEIHEVNQCCNDGDCTSASDVNTKEEERQKKQCCESQQVEHHHIHMEALETSPQKSNCHNHDHEDNQDHDQENSTIGGDEAFQVSIDIAMGGGGCCSRSYLKKCCGHGHLLEGGLQEIITD